MRALRRLCDCRSGATALEFAIVSLFLVLTAIAVVDFGRGFHVRNNMSHAADVGARKLLIDPAISDGTLEDAIRAAFTAAEPDLLEIGIASETVDGASYRAVTMEYPLSLHVPGFESSPVTVTILRRIPST